jgi:endo-1,4-beta-xylanase
MTSFSFRLPGFSATALSLLLIASAVAAPRQKQAQSSTSTLREAAEKRHIFIGAAADPKFLGESEYARILSSEFNQLQGENAMKFASLHPRPDSDPNPYNFAPADQLVDFAQAHKMAVRGHTLVWHRQVPDWVQKGAYSAPQLSSILQNHIRKVMTHYAGKIYAWDVVNESFNEDGSMRSALWYDQPGIGAGEGTEYIEQSFRWAHEADPKAKLFYNDFDTEEINRKSDAIYAMAADFKKRGVPLDGVGFQAHVTLTFDDPAKIASFAKNLERFAKLGLELHITELDVRMTDSSEASLATQARIYGEITKACVQQPACKLIQTWGFTDKHSWIPGFFKGYGWALPWDDKYQKKPAHDAVLKELQ